MTQFQFDTSGYISLPTPSQERPSLHTATYWPDLSPFVRGYVKAMAQDFRFFHMECPACEWDCIVGPPRLGDLNLICPCCAGDNGRDVGLRTISGERDLPKLVEGNDARNSLRFDCLAPETLARIMEDCAAHERSYPLTTADPRRHNRGLNFWRNRQAGMWTSSGWPPLNVVLSGTGKVVFQ